MHTRRTTIGFTVTELLIAIVVIAILVTLAVLSVSVVQVQQRDQARSTAVKIVMTAAEGYYEKHGEYPHESELNPLLEPLKMTDYSGASSTLGLPAETFIAGGSDFYFLACGTLTSQGKSCEASSTNWINYRAKQIIYMSRSLARSGDSTQWWIRTAANYGDNSGWGCELITHYLQPSFIIAWRSELTKKWVFERGNHGRAEIKPWGGGPAGSQTCSFNND